MDNQRKYQVRRFAGYVNVSSSGHYSADFVFNWGIGIRTGHFCLEDCSIVFPRKGKNKNASIVTQYPKYLKIDIFLSLYAALMGKILKFYEYDQWGTPRYEKLRYHTDFGFYDFALRISRQLESFSPDEMVAIFNKHCPPSDTIMNTTSGDGDLVKITYPAYIHDGNPKVGVHRLDTNRRDNWALEFIAPVFQNL